MEFTMRENNKKNKKIWIGILVCALMITAVSIFLVKFHVEQTLAEFVVELGDPVTEDIHFYLTGEEWSLGRAQLDLGDVEADKIGTYEIRVDHAWHHFTYQVTIQDTTPPELELREGPIYLEKGVSYGTDDFVVKAWDVSGDVRLDLVKESSGPSKSVTYSNCGDYTFTVTAQDGNGNAISGQISVTVDTAPVFGEMPQYYISVGNTFDQMEGITAYDDVDGDVTPLVCIVDSNLDADSPGVYYINYNATDSYGLTGTGTMLVHVYDPMDLQELINTHRINRHEQIILGAINLYDGGVYEDNDIDFILEEMEPALVCLKHEFGNGGYDRGSGYIVEINDEEIIICTNAHVVSGYDTWDIYFHDGSKLQGTVIDMLGSPCYETDIAFVRVDRSKASEELMDTLKTVHISRKYWEELDNREQLDLGIRCIVEKGKVWINRTGSLKKKKSTIPPDSNSKYGTFTELGVKVQPGMSGSAVFDGYGNLIAMVVSHSTYNGESYNWAITLDQILAGYEKVMGRSLNYE